MTIKISLPMVMAVALLLGSGCKKNDPTPNKAPEQSGTAGAATPQETTAPANSKTVATYPDMIPQSGTKQLLQPFTVYQAADNTSAVLTRVSTGQWINLKGSRGDWMMIEWPSGVGQMSPGWIELHGGASDSRLAQTPPANPVQTTPPPPTAPPPPPPPTKPPGRGVVLKPRRR